MKRFTKKKNKNKTYLRGQIVALFLLAQLKVPVTYSFKQD